LCEDKNEEILKVFAIREDFECNREEFVNCAEFDDCGEDFKIDWKEFGSDGEEFMNCAEFNDDGEDFV
jgi:hypothetical protein